MKKSVKALLLVLCAVVLVVATVFTTLAFMTSQDTVVNTFTVGSVNITLDETDVTIYGVQDTETRVKANVYKLIPGHEYIKDPTIHVAEGSEQSYYFAKIQNDLGTNVVFELNDGWEWHDEANGVARYTNYAAIDASAEEKDLPAVFSTFEVIQSPNYGDLKFGGVDGEATITVTGYAIQTDGLTGEGGVADYDAAWNALVAAQN